MLHAGRTSIDRSAHWPPTLWLTGLSGAGKSTLATDAQAVLAAAGHACQLLDGDRLRAGPCRDLGFSPADRRENIRRAAQLAQELNQAGQIVLCALISPMAADRAMASKIIGPARFIEIHLSATLAVCERRDAKGLYARARRGEIGDFTGVSAPYEAPLAPAAAIDTAVLTREAACLALLATLSHHARTTRAGKGAAETALA
jgi:adenylylsulfate kinase